jgi:hypothetical protein
MNNLVDPTTVRKFIGLLHARATTALRGTDAPQGVLHLCKIDPTTGHIFTSAYFVSDAERMTADALIDAGAGVNVYAEPRLVRPGLPSERGKLNATLGVFAFVVDSDADTNRKCAADIPASVVVETSPGNYHLWFFLDRAIGGSEAQELGKLIRKNGGGDHCSGNPVQPYRVAGTPNIPCAKKIARGRAVVATRLRLVSDRTYSAEELRAAFAAIAPPPAPQRPTPQAETQTTARRPRYCRSKARAILAAEVSDRSAAFMSAANYAAMGGVTAEEFEAMARQHVNGCAGKYLEDGDRLRAEVDRCYAKMGVADAPATDEPEHERRARWYQNVVTDRELAACALRFATLILFHDDDSRHVQLSVRAAAAKLGVGDSTARDGREQLIAREWLIPTAVGSLALGRGP